MGQRTSYMGLRLNLTPMLSDINVKHSHSHDDDDNDNDNH